MPGWSNTYASKVGNHFLRNSAQARDANLYLAALTTLGADDATGFVEVDAVANVDYARQGGAAGSLFAAASNRVVLNAGLQTFIGAAAAPWGVVTGLAIVNHVSNAIGAGTLVAFGPLDTPISVLAGSSLAFAAGSISVTAPSFFTTAYGNKVLEHFLRDNNQAPDAVVALGLYTAQPDASLGTGGTECAAAWYARKSLGLAAFSNGVASNAGDLAYVSDAGADGGVLQYGVLATSLTAGGGSVIGSGSLSAGIVAGLHSTVDFPAGSVSVKID